LLITRRYRRQAKTDKPQHNYFAEVLVEAVLAVPPVPPPEVGASQLPQATTGSGVPPSQLDILPQFTTAMVSPFRKVSGYEASMTIMEKLE